jgi:threonine dehydrogenase-like Zn-dependent dehydrogenase
VVFKELIWKEARVVSSRVSHGEFAEVIGHFELGRLHPDVLISRTIHGSQAQQAFELLENHPEENIKMMLGFAG